MEALKRSKRGAAMRWWSLLRLCAAAGMTLLILSLHLLLHNAPAPEERAVCAARKRWCCGHRGARTLAPENTISAFLTALKVGANCIEMDVHRTSDGVVAVVHANHLRSKVLPANGVQDVELIRVEDVAWDRLQGLDAGSWFGESFRNERIPQLTTVLEIFWDVDVRLIVELKAEKCAKSSSQCERLWKWEQRYVESLKEALVRVQKDHFGRDGRPPRFSLLFDSFNHSLVDELAEGFASLSKSNLLASRLASGLGYILDPHFNYTGDKFKDSVTWLAPHVSKVTQAVSSSRCVSSWVTDSRETIEQQFKLGVQAVTTNLPSLCPTISLAP